MRALLALLLLTPLGAALAQQPPEPPPDDRPMAVPWWQVDEQGNVVGPYPEPPPPQPDPQGYAPPPPEAYAPPPPPAPTPPPRRGGPVDRVNKLAIGLKTGSLVGGYKGADAEATYGDLSVGLLARYRLAPIGVEVSVVHADQAWGPDTTRSQTLVQGSLMGFFFWSRRLQPFVDVGLTANAYRLDDDIGVNGGTTWVTRSGVAAGPHVGLGLELNLGKRVALEAEARMVHYLAFRNDWPKATQVQGTLGLLVHLGKLRR